MVEGEGLGAMARRVIDSNQFMTLATADEAGLLWSSPVWYTVTDYRQEFFWVSSPRPGIRATSPCTRRKPS